MGEPPVPYVAGDVGATGAAGAKTGAFGATTGAAGAARSGVGAVSPPSGAGEAGAACSGAVSGAAATETRPMPVLVAAHTVGGVPGVAEGTVYAGSDPLGNVGVGHGGRAGDGGGVPEPPDWPPLIGLLLMGRAPAVGPPACGGGYGGGGYGGDGTGPAAGGCGGGCGIGCG